MRSVHPSGRAPRAQSDAAPGPVVHRPTLAGGRLSLVGKPTMRGLRWLRLTALLLTALSLTMESAHVLEWPQKAAYLPEMYAAVNGSLYRYFATVGGVYQIGSIVAAAALAALIRDRRRAFAWTAAGAALLLAAFAVWLVVVAPVNQQVAELLSSAPASVPSLWQRLAFRWEAGHAVGFALQLLGLAALQMSVLVEIPERSGAPTRGPVAVS